MSIEDKKIDVRFRYMADFDRAMHAVHMLAGQAAGSGGVRRRALWQGRAERISRSRRRCRTPIPSGHFQQRSMYGLSIENSGKDDEGDSIENQTGICREYIEARPYLNLVRHLF